MTGSTLGPRGKTEPMLDIAWIASNWRLDSPEIQAEPNMTDKKINEKGKNVINGKLVRKMSPSTQMPLN